MLNTIPEDHNIFIFSISNRQYDVIQLFSIFLVFIIILYTLNSKTIHN